MACRRCILGDLQSLGSELDNSGDSSCVAEVFVDGCGISCVDGIVV